VGAYPPHKRVARLERFLYRRQNRVWEKIVKYDVRKSFADSRLRVKGRFVKKEDVSTMRERRVVHAVVSPHACSPLLLDCAGSASSGLHAVGLELSKGRRGSVRALDIVGGLFRHGNSDSGDAELRRMCLTW
jgi:hypothetical protein